MVLTASGVPVENSYNFEIFFKGPGKLMENRYQTVQYFSLLCECNAWTEKVDWYSVAQTAFRMVYNSKGFHEL